MPGIRGLYLSVCDAAVRVPELKAELRPIEDLLAQDRKKREDPPAP